MALFAQQPRKDEPILKPESKVESPPERPVTPPPGSVRRMEEQPMGMTQPKPSESVLGSGLTIEISKSKTCVIFINQSESVLGSGLTIEGKIEGNGNIRVSGRFKGTVNVKGELTIEPGAAIDGEVNADTVLVAGEVRGQIVASSRVEFKESGTLIGDLKAGSLTVAAGSRMRGKVEFGWKEGELEEAPQTEGGPALVR